MTRPVIVVRPEPGNSCTARRLVTAGVPIVRLPFFEAAPLDWSPPDPSAFDAILLTSANAVRHAGEGLKVLRDLPVIAVGEATASAARAGGLKIAIVGDDNLEAATRLASDAGYTRWLHLAGRHRTCGSGARATVVVYASETVPIGPRDLARLEGGIVLLHSTRAARRLIQLADPHRLERVGISLVAISAKVADAAGSGWEQIVTASAPTDAAMVEAARMLAIDRPDGGGDKAA